MVVDPPKVRRDEGAGDPHIFLIPKKMIRILQLEGETDQGRNGAERDITLLPIQTHAEHVFSFKNTATDDSRALSGRRIAPRLRTRDGEARNLLSSSEPG